MRALALLSSLALPIAGVRPAFAQEAVADVAADPASPDAAPDTAPDPAPDITPEDTLSVIARWQAAPDTVFDATEINLYDLLYVARPLIVLAQSPNDPMVAEQLDLIFERVNELVARDVIIILDTDPAAASPIRAQLRPRGFSMVLITKDGRIALRKPVPWSVREIVHTIDRLPIRQQELRGN